MFIDYTSLLVNFIYQHHGWVNFSRLIESQMILFLFCLAPVEGMNYVIEIFRSLTICWWRVWRESEIVSTFMHFKVEEGWVCISPLRKWKTAWHIILFRLESLIPHLKLFRMLLQTVAVAKDISKKGMQANGKLITIFGYCQDISSEKIHFAFLCRQSKLVAKHRSLSTH